MLADVCDHLGDPEDGLYVLAEAHSLVEQHDERWWEAEVCHLRGVVLLRQKVTGQVGTLGAALQGTGPALLSLLDALPDDSPFLQLDPSQRRQRTLTALKRVLLRESQVQPVLLVFEDLHWIDSETQVLLDSLVESLPTARLLLLVNYRPEYEHGYGRNRHTVRQDRPAGTCPRRVLHHHRAVPRYADDILAAPGRGRTGAGFGVMVLGCNPASRCPGYPIEILLIR